MLNPIAKRWVEKLRSGEFVQGTGKLRDCDDRRCCLGVLCDLAVDDEVIPPPIYGEDVERFLYGPDGDLCGEVLPNDVREYAGLRHPSGAFDSGDGHESALWWFNDTGKKTFAEIADIIESEPPGLFVEQAVTA